MYVAQTKKICQLSKSNDTWEYLEKFLAEYHSECILWKDAVLNQGSGTTQPGHKALVVMCAQIHIFLGIPILRDYSYSGHWVKMSSIKYFLSLKSILCVSLNYFPNFEIKNIE